MDQNQPFGITVAVPHNYATPFHEVVNQLSSIGMNVEKAHPDARAIQGSGTQNTLNKLKEMGLPASRVQKLSYKV